MMGEKAISGREAVCTDTSANETFEALWQQHRPRIWRLVARLAGSVDHADDLTQEVSLRAFQAFSEFRGQSAAFTWFYRIAVNVVLRYRERQPTSTLSLDAPQAAMLSAQVSLEPSPTALRAELSTRVQAALDRLPEEWRVPLILHTYEQLKYREIAEVLAIPVGTVMSRIFYARRRLQEELKDYVQDTL
jgi:RNA polymerase sigma-70 factor, ECF subfamily